MKVKKKPAPRARRRATPPALGPFCPETIEDGSPCTHAAGFRTDHPGQGYCYIHGGTVLMGNGRYRQVVHNSLRNKLDRIARDEQSLMDLAPEATLLRALVIDFVNRYQDFSEALLAWYQDGKAEQKPRRIIDIADAGRLVEAVSRVVHRMHQIQSEGAISLDTFKRVTEMMGIVVTKYVSDPEVLNAIETGWAGLPVDAKGPANRSVEDADIAADA